MCVLTSEQYNYEQGSCNRLQKLGSMEINKHCLSISRSLHILLYCSEANEFGKILLLD